VAVGQGLLGGAWHVVRELRERAEPQAGADPAAETGRAAPLP
jgi:hypothetical protein